jgi:hypothetical protein
MVRLALEGGGIPQGDEVRLPSRGGDARIAERLAKFLALIAS